MEITRKKHRGGISHKEHLHPVPKCFVLPFFQEIVRFYPRFSGSVTSFTVFTLEVVEKRNIFPLPEGGDAPPGWLSR